MERAEIGRRVRAVRKARGISQAELARLAGRSQQQISHIENGTSDTTLGTLQAIAEALDCRLCVDLLHFARDAGEDGRPDVASRISDLAPHLPGSAMQTLRELLSTWESLYGEPHARA